MLKVALTGGIGSGKSAAGEIFAKLGAIVVDSDQISREVIERGKPGFDEVVAQFGDEILRAGDIDRNKLGEIVFNDPHKRSELEKIIHPRVRQVFDEIANSVSVDGILINQIPLLVETNGAANFDVVISITTPIEIRKKRLLSRGMKDYEIEKRISAQATDEERAAVSDFILDNSGDEFALTSQVEDIYEKLKARASSN